MGNRGEDASRPNGAWGRQPPRQSSPGAGAGGAGAWDDRSRGYWQDDDYPQGGDAGYGYRPDDGYGGQDEGYGRRDAGSEPGWGGYQQSGGYPAAPQGSGGYQALPQGSGGYPAAPQGSGGYQEQDAGNDWYGGQPAAANGASFADTGTYRLNGRIIDEYGTGPRGTFRDDDRGYPPSPEQGYGRQEHGAGGGYPIADDEYDDYRDNGYQAPGRYDDAAGYDDYDQAASYEGASGGGRDGYQDYGDYGTASGPYGERYDSEKDSRGEERHGRGAARGAGKSPLSGGKLLLAALTVVVLGIAGAAAYVFVLKPKSPVTDSNAAAPLPTGSAESSQAACAKELGQFCHIQYRTGDPVPLTTSELFPPAFTSEADKISYQLVSTKVDKTCSNAVIGTDLSTALKNGKCTQVLRATYVSGNGKIMGTIGVINLATTNQAHYAGKVVGQNDFIAPLTASKGVAKKLGKATGVVQSEFKGHYLILTWSEFVDGTTPSTSAQDTLLQQFGSDLVSGTANISLSQRMATGAAATGGAA